MRKLLSLTLAIMVMFGVLCSSLLNTGAIETDVGGLSYRVGNYEYKILSNGTAEITDYLGSAKVPDIPRTIGGYTVTSIGTSAFCYFTTFTKVTIPDTVKNISDYAFTDCINLKEIRIPYSVQKIGKGLFLGCNYLSKIVVDSSNKYYDSRNSCNAIIETATNKLRFGSSNAVIPDGVVSIGEAAFFFLFELTEIVIPDSVTEIENSAFSSCHNLVKVTFGNSVVSIGDEAFLNCQIKSISFPESLTRIGESAFSRCHATEVTIPASVTKIGINAFSDCKYLDDIVIKNPYCTFGEAGGFGYQLVFPSHTTIRGFNNSTAQEYAYVFDNTFISLGDTPVEALPIIREAEVNNSGIKLVWNKVHGGEYYGYRVFVKNGSSWKALTTVSGFTNSYVDTTAKVGNSYTYTIRCVDNYDAYIADYDKTGFTVRFLETPEIVSFKNKRNGAEIKWTEVEGAQKYRLYVKNGDSWDKLADTTETSYIHTGLQDNTNYTYTVRCVSEDSNTPESGYNNAGTTNKYVAIVLGDVDGDGEVSVLDATAVQLYIAGLSEMNKDSLFSADTDKDGDVSIMDATAIQLFVARIIEEF